METLSQPIDQPTLPPAGDADSLAGVGPATSTAVEEKISQETPESESKTTVVVFVEEEELRKLCDEADSKAKELIGLYHALQVRISAELFPILLRIKTLLPHGEWTPWYDNFCKRHHITTSMRTVQRAFTELTGDRLLMDGKPNAKSTRNGVTPSEPEAVTIARRELAELEGQIGASPTGDDAQRLHAEYKDKLAAAISQAQIKSTAPLPIIDGTRADEGLLDGVEAVPVPIPAPRKETREEVHERLKNQHAELQKRQAKGINRTKEDVDREHLRFLAHRLDSLKEALQQVFDDKAKWSKYPEYAEVVSLGEKIADLVKLL